MIKKLSIAIVALLVFVLAIGSASAIVVTHSVDGHTYSVDVSHIPTNANDNSNPSKYVPISIMDRLGDGCGSIYVSNLAHNSLFSNEFTIQRLDAGNVTFSSGGFASPQLVARMTKLGNATTEEFNGGGLWDGRVAPGIYLLTLADGNGGQPEMIIVRVAFNSIERATFIGHATSSGSDNPKNATITSGCLGIDIDSINMVQTGVKNVTTYEPNTEDVTAYFRDHQTTIMSGQTNDWAWLNSFVKYYGSSFYDPAVGTEKSITVKFIDNNGIHTMNDANVNQNGLDYFVTDLSGKGVRVISATYGDPSHTHKVVTTYKIYGIEINIDVDSAKIAIDNPNQFPVDVGFSFDVNYAHDVSINGPVDIKWTKQTFTEYVKKVSGKEKFTYYLGDVDAVGSVGFDAYVPFIDGAKVTSTKWYPY